MNEPVCGEVLKFRGNMIDRITKASLFMPCIADSFYPSIGRATIKTLKAAGVNVDYPVDQTCCGQWAVNMGKKEAALSMAIHFIRIFEPSSYIVCPSGSCVLTVRNYPELFAVEPEMKARAQAVAEKTFELMDFLVNVLGVTDLGSTCNATAALHDSCHPLRGLGLKDEPRRLLRNVKGLKLVEMADPEVCCGFGGAFMAKQAPLSKAMADEKVDQALDTGADYLVMTEPGCLLNVDSVMKARKTNMKAVHIAEVLAGSIASGQ